MVELLVDIGIVLLNTLFWALVLLGLPGAWLMIATCALVEWQLEPSRFSEAVLITATALAAVAELFEFLASSRGAKKAGARRRGSVGALLGGIVGAVLGTFLLPIPILGTIAGGALGAFGGSTLFEREDGRDLTESMRVGRGAARGYLLGIMGKLTIAAVIWALLCYSVFW